MACAKSPVLPVTVIVYEPGEAEEEIVKVEPETMIPYASMLHTDAEIAPAGLLVTEEHSPASPGLNPLPEIDTTVLTGPELGTSVMEAEGVPTVNPNEMDGDAVLSVKVIVYPPGATFATTKLPLIVPLVV